MGDGALLGLAEWMFSVLNGPRNGLVDGVNANSEVGALPDRMTDVGGE